MALRYELGKIHNWEECLEKNSPLPLTTAIIWASMAIDMGKITKENYKEFYTRTAMWERVFGPFLMMPQGERRITQQEIERYIGLVTNVRERSSLQFNKKIGSLVREQAQLTAGVYDDHMFEEVEDDHEDTNAMGAQE